MTKASNSGLKSLAVPRARADEFSFVKGWGGIDFSLPTLDRKDDYEDANHPVLRHSRVRLYSAALST
jgi:hypothetical protein